MAGKPLPLGSPGLSGCWALHMPPSARLAVCPLQTLGVSGLNLHTGSTALRFHQHLEAYPDPPPPTHTHCFRMHFIFAGFLSGGHSLSLSKQGKQCMERLEGQGKTSLHKRREGGIKYRVPWRCRVLLLKSSASRGQGKAARWTTRQGLPCHVRSLPEGLYTCVSSHCHSQS